MTSGKETQKMSVTRKKRQNKKIPTVQTVSDTSLCQDQDFPQLESQKTSLAQRTDKYAPKLNELQKDWLVQAAIFMGGRRKIQDEFKKEFGMTISYDLIYYYRYSPTYEQRRKEIRTEYDRKMSDEYISSKRNRLKTIQDILEWAVDDRNIESLVGSRQSRFDVVKYKQMLALDCIKAADQMLDDKKHNFNVMNLTQVNQFSEWNLTDIRKEKAKLLSQLEKVKIEKKGE